MSKGVHKKTLQLEKVFVTCNNYTLLSMKNTQMWILRPQSSVPWDPNDEFWLAQQWLTLFAFVAFIKMLCCYSMQGNGTWHTKTWWGGSFTTLTATNAPCIGVNPVLAPQLWQNFLIRHSTNMDMMRNLIMVSGTLRIEQYWQPLQPLTKNTKRLWLMLLMI